MRIENRVVALVLTSLLLGVTGCASGAKEQEKDEFFTSGNREADRRGSGSVSDAEKGRKEASSKRDPKTGAPIEEKKTTLYERLGGEERIRLIVDDFIKRVLEDPRVNWTRKGVDGGILRRDPEAWNPTPENVKRLKEHFVQFISLAAGGPAKYDGKPMKTTHAEMRITKSEFDATIGDLKATLDNLNVPNDVQKDLLAIFESARAQIVPDK